MAHVAAKRDISSAESEELSRDAKRAKPDDKNGEEGENEPEWEDVLSTFTTSSVSSDSAREKIMFVHGKIADSDAVVVSEKTPIREDTSAELFRGSKLRSEMRNDIYSSYRLQAPPHLNEIKTTVVCPATEKHVKKYRRQESFSVEETGEDYRSVTSPYIQEQSLSSQWVYNILEKKAEADRIVYDDPDPEVGFVSLPDLKWDQKQVDDSYSIAIARQKDIKSLRDLSSEHLPSSQNIFKRGKEVIQQRYNLPASKSRVYSHYQPSYYHLHVHFTKSGYDAPGCGVERAHSLSDVILNSQTDPQFYKTRTLYFALRAEDGSLGRFKEAGRL